MTADVPPSPPTLVLIAGFARAGKDTLASGILEWSRRPAVKLNFADALKEAGNEFLSYLHLSGDFFNEEFKVQHRDFLVSAGQFARSINKDVFAYHLANFAPCTEAPCGEVAQTVVCSDLRYLNEIHVCQEILTPLGWRVRTVYLATAGVYHANDEEFYSVLDMKSNHRFDQEFIFRPNARQDIINEGKRLALSWQL